MEASSKEVEDKNRIFLDWCFKNGVVAPKLEWPARFEGGLLGVKATSRIDYREAFVFVPFNLMLTLETARHSEISRVFEEH